MLKDSGMIDRFSNYYPGAGLIYRTKCGWADNVAGGEHDVFNSVAGTRPTQVFERDAQKNATATRIEIVGDVSIR